MKRIVASVGVVALGTSFVQAVESGALTEMQTTKPWSVSASLRGFYDDNINAESSDKNCSSGFEVSPSLFYGRAGEQTSLNFSYTFSGKYYERAREGSVDHWDNSHIVGATLSHAFTPRTSVRVSDSFVIGQEPDILRAGNSFDTFETISGDNLRNYASVALNIQVTELLGFEVGYDNTIFDYDADELSALLDRMDNAFHLDSRWRLSQQTTGIFGYRYSQADYTGDADLDLLGTFQSEDRNSRSHYIYGGLEHEFTPDLSGSIKAGAILTDYYNDDSPNASSAEWDPYVSAGLNWTMRPGTSLGVGVNVDNSAANSGVSGGELVRDTQTTVLYAKLAHQILAQLFSDFSATWQHAVYNGGGTGTDGKGVDYLLLSANLQYRFNRNFSTSLGYSFDNVTDSRAEGIDYSRNRIYFGVTATY